jgi:hypothetical protein
MPYTPRPRPLEKEPPGHGLRGLRKTEGAKGDAYLNRVAVEIETPRGSPDGIPGEVLEPLGCAENSVGLNPIRVDPELEAPPLVVEGVDENGEMIVEHETTCVVPIHEVSTHLLRLVVVGLAANKQTIRIEGDATDGSNRRLRHVPRGPFPTEWDLRCTLPSLVIEDTIHANRGVRTVNREGR